jgi:histidine triad (HIT) family protein
MPEPTLFERIVRREVPADIVYQDDQVTAFRDIRPRAPVHVLIVPNKAIPTTDDVTEADEPMLGHMFTVARRVAEAEGLDKGYRLLVNCKEHAHQEVFHVHMHLFGGRPLGPMLARQEG